MNYTCELCNKKFGQKSHYDAHKNKKNTCKKCDKNFTTEWAYINKECIHISVIDHNSKHKFKCKNGHELILCNGKIRRPYFKHKNKEHTTENAGMCFWHSRWQGYFKNTEIEFNKINNEQIKNRRADVLLNDKYILEVQHSDISDSEVICRTDDYKLHDKELIWLVDGNTNDIILDTLSDNTYLIEFNDTWKYKSFIYKYEFILLDIKDKIFKIPVKRVSNKLFHAKSYVDVDKVIDTLTNNPYNIWGLWCETNEILPVLKITQQGAGNGKTYSIWKNISINFDKESYIIITKQHPAKEVIRKELDDQAERHEFHIIDNLDELEYYKYNKQFIVCYKHKHSNRKCKVIIGTVDSFFYCISSKSINSNDYWCGLTNNILENGCDKINKNTGSVRYAGENITLNQKTEIWIDEANDLPIYYYKAIVRLMLDTRVNCVIVGDKLQSLEYIENFMTHIDDNTSFIKIIRDNPININRRIKVKHMADKINKLVTFSEYNLPEITTDDILEDDGEPVIETFQQTCVYANDTNKRKITNEADKIIDMVEAEVNKHNYMPHNFLFVFPILKYNVLACELETKLNKFWLDRLDNTNYEQYAVLHKHQEGKIIDTAISRHASRIMSIRASKGDGREVVFVLNCTESSLKILSNHEKNIVYESYLHVALTRAKRKIYFGIQFNNDDVHKRFLKINEAFEPPNVNLSFSIDNILMYINKNDFSDLIQNNNIQYKEEEDLDNTNSSSLIDWDYHCIRHSIYYNYALFEIFKYNKDSDSFKKSQIKTILNKISQLPIKRCTPGEFYNYINSITEIYDSFEFFPLCVLSDKPIYQKYCDQIEKRIISIQQKYKKDNLSIGDLQPFDSAILIYLIDVYMNKKFHTCTPTTLYNIAESYDNNNKIQKMIEESKNMKNIMMNLMSKILKKNHKIKWNIEHIMLYNGKSLDIKLRNRCDIVGHDENTVHHIVLQTDYNKLNFKDTISKILVERFIINNSKGNNKSRFDNKKIITYLLILKQNRYEIFDFDFENNINNDIKKMCTDAVIKYCKTFNTELFNYCKFIKNNKHKWREYRTPYKFMANAPEIGFCKIPYIANFFNDLDKDCKNNLNHVKNITDNFNLFEEKINEYIVDICETYFGLNEVNDDTVW